MSKKIFTAGSGNIFLDLGFNEQEAAELTIKACLFRTLQKALKESSFSQTELAHTLKIPQPKISNIINGRMSGFSVERLANYLLKLNYNICLAAYPAPPGRPAQVIALQKRNLASIS